MRDISTPIGNFLLGYIFLSKDIDRERYIKQSFKTSKISVIIENTSAIYNDVPISEVDLQNCKFPENSETLGSAVLLAVIENHNKPIVIKVLNLGDEMNSINSEFQKKINSNYENNMVEIDLNSKQSTFIVNVRSKTEKNSKVIFNISDKNDKSEMSFNVNGVVNFNLFEFFNIISNNGFKIKVIDERGIEKSSLTLSSEELGIICKNFVAKFSDFSLESEKVSVDSKLIKLGGDSPSVLGDELTKLLQKIITACSTINIGDINSGANAAKFSAFLPELLNILSKNVTLK